MKGEESIQWAGTIAAPSITPAAFCALVSERATTSAPPVDSGGNSVHDGPDPSAGIQLKYTVPEYLEAFRTLRVTPRPCKQWLGSKWQRQLAELIIEQKKNPASGKAQQGAGCSQTPVDSTAAMRERSEAKAPSTVGMSQAFVDQLKTRRRDELKKAQEKAAEEKRNQERLARTNAKVLDMSQPLVGHMCAVLLPPDPL